MNEHTAVQAQEGTGPYPQTPAQEAGLDLAEQMERIKDEIKTRGFALHSFFGARGPVTHTLGLAEQGLPELCFSGDGRVGIALCVRVATNLCSGQLDPGVLGGRAVLQPSNTDEIAVIATPRHEGGFAELAGELTLLRAWREAQRVQRPRALVEIQAVPAARAQAALEAGAARADLVTLEAIAEARARRSATRQEAVN